MREHTKIPRSEVRAHRLVDIRASNATLEKDWCGCSISPRSLVGVQTLHKRFLTNFE